MTIFSPFRADILLHFHVSPEPHPRQCDSYEDDDLFASTLKEFLDLGVIKVEKTEPMVRYVTTPLGAAWVESMMRCRVPRIAYVDQNDNILGYAQP